MKPPLSRKTLLWGIGTQKKGKYDVLWWDKQIDLSHPHSGERPPYLSSGSSVLNLGSG